MKKDKFKEYVKTRVRISALTSLKEMQQGHSKVKNIKYQKVETSLYLRSPLFDVESCQILFSLKTRTIRGIKKNFSEMFSDVKCPLRCNHLDSLENLLTCTVLTSNLQCETVTSNTIVFEDIFSNDVVKQRQITELFSQLLQIRDRLLNSLPAATTGFVH